MTAVAAQPSSRVVDLQLVDLPIETRILVTNRAGRQFISRIHRSRIAALFAYPPHRGYRITRVRGHRLPRNAGFVIIDPPDQHEREEQL